MCVLKHLAKQQTGGNSFVDTLFHGLQEQSRLKIRDWLRRFIEVVKIGDLEKKSEAIRVGPNFRQKRSQTRRAGKGWTNGHSEEVKKVCCALSPVPTWETAEWTTACGRRLARCLPSHLQSGMGEFLQRVRGNEQGSQSSPPKWGTSGPRL